MGSAEAAIAQKFVEAANTYGGNAAALHLRAMNIIYETTKERGATILMPTSMVDSMSVALPAAINARAGAGVEADRDGAARPDLRHFDFQVDGCRPPIIPVANRAAADNDDD